MGRRTSSWVVWVVPCTTRASHGFVQDIVTMRLQNQSETKQGEMAGIRAWSDVEKNTDIDLLFFLLLYLHLFRKSTERTAGGSLLALTLRLERIHHSARGGKRIDWRRQHSPIPKHLLYTVLEIPWLGYVQGGFKLAKAPMVGGVALSRSRWGRGSRRHVYSQQQFPAFSAAFPAQPGREGRGHQRPRSRPVDSVGKVLERKPKHDGKASGEA